MCKILQNLCNYWHYHELAILLDLDAGIVGLGLAYTISLAGILQYCVRQSAEVENIVSKEFICFLGFMN